MTNITPSTPSFVFGYWRPWKENSNYVDSYLNYAKDVSLAKYQADTVGQYINQASAEHVHAIGELGSKIGLASREQVQAIGALGDKIGEMGNQIGMGLNVLSNKMESVNEELSFVNRNLVIHIEQQKVSNLLLENIGELLRVPNSEKERQHSIELGLKFFVNAYKDEDLFQDALEELLKAEELMKQDYFVLHRIGLIYLHSINHINPQKALDYFTRAAKYASVESDPKAARLANVLAQYGNRVNSAILNDTNAIESLAADSYEKAAFTSYVLGDFESAVKLQSKAVKYNSSSENYFMLAKYQARTEQIDLCIENISLSIDKTPIIIKAVFKDLDLINEPAVLKTIEEKNKIIEEKNEVLNKKLLQLINDWSFAQSDPVCIKELKDALNEFDFNKKLNIINLAIKADINNWATANLDVDHFRNGDIIPEAKSTEEWVKAGSEGNPAWCYPGNDPSNGIKYGKLYNWYTVNDSRGLAPDGWHIPSQDEWSLLIQFLGGHEKAGLKLKSATDWKDNKNGTNESGFNGLPCGGRFGDGGIGSIGAQGYWWTCTVWDSDNAVHIALYSWGDAVSIGALTKDSKYAGYSVRCIKD